MRPGLVAVGAAFALVGAGVILAVLWAPDAPSVTRSHGTVVDSLAPGDWRQFTVPATASSSAQLSIQWTASDAVVVDWYYLYHCTNSSTGWCPPFQPIVSWFGNTSGNWSYSGGAAAYYLLYVQDDSNAPVNFSATFVEHYRPSTLTLEPLPLAVVLAGGSLLTGTGAVGLYLGLFLPPGVYSAFAGPPPELWSEEELAPADGSEDAPSPRP